MRIPAAILFYEPLKRACYVMKLSDHKAASYIWRSVQPDEQDLADALFALTERFFLSVALRYGLMGLRLSRF